MGSIRMKRRRVPSGLGDCVRRLPRLQTSEEMGMSLARLDKIARQLDSVILACRAALKWR